MGQSIISVTKVYIIVFPITLDKQCEREKKNPIFTFTYIENHKHFFIFRLTHGTKKNDLFCFFFCCTYSTFTHLLIMPMFYCCMVNNKKTNSLKACCLLHINIKYKAHCIINLIRKHAERTIYRNISKLNKPTRVCWYIIVQS